MKFFKEYATRERKRLTKQVMLTNEVSTIFQRGLPPKLGDLGCYFVDIMLGDGQVAKGMLDCGASINLMPYSIYKQFKVGPLKPVNMCLQMANGTKERPLGMCQDVLCQIDKVVVPIDFIVSKIAEGASAKRNETILLGRPFLRTSHACVKYFDGELTLSVMGETVRFDLAKAREDPAYAWGIDCTPEEEFTDHNEECVDEYIGKTFCGVDPSSYEDLEEFDEEETADLFAVHMDDPKNEAYWLKKMCLAEQDIPIEHEIVSNVQSAEDELDKELAQLFDIEWNDHGGEVDFEDLDLFDPDEDSKAWGGSYYDPTGNYVMGKDEQDDWDMRVADFMMKAEAWETASQP